MGAPTILFNEAAALDALRQFVTTVVPEVPEVDVYRARQSAAPSRWGLSVLLVPTTPVPVLASYMGDQSTGTQRQLARLVVRTPAAASWRARLLGQQSAAYVAGAGETSAQVRDGVKAALAALALPVALSDTAASLVPAGSAGVDVLADVAGVSMLAGWTVVPAGGVATVSVVDDCLRRAAYNWGTWTVRVVVREVAPAGGDRPCMVGPYVERLRLTMQAGASVPVTNGSAFPYVQDHMGGSSRVSTLPLGGSMCWRQTLGPGNADVQDNGTWVRGAWVDFVFDTPAALYYDVPSLDVIMQGSTVVE